MTDSHEDTKLMVNLGDHDLYRQLHVAAAEEDMTVPEIVREAVCYWLSHRDEVEAALGGAAADRVMAESTGEQIPLEEVKRRLGQSTRSA
jgi:hypothetical protein